MATYTVKSPDYPNSKPAYQATEWPRKRGHWPDVRYEAFTVALICACAGVREEVYEDDVLIWQSLNCRPVRGSNFERSDKKLDRSSCATAY